MQHRQDCGRTRTFWLSHFYLHFYFAPPTLKWGLTSVSAKRVSREHVTSRRSPEPDQGPTHTSVFTFSSCAFSSLTSLYS